MSLRLRDRVALITGAGSGIGRAAACLFASEGARVMVVDVDEKGAIATVESIRAAGGEAEFARANVSKAADVCAAVRFAETCFGGLHVLFNNAGIMPEEDGSVLDTDEAVFDRVIAINLRGVFLGCKYGIPALLRAGGGTVINTASLVAVMGSATSQVAYTASKGGILALSRELAVEFARRGVRVNALCPGPVRTPLMEPLLADQAFRARRFVHLPMGRLAEVEEVARAALFLASDESSYVNGATFLVDGGTSGAYVTPE